MPEININAQDWQATAAEFAGENMRLRAALQAAGRELNQLASAADGPDDRNPDHPDDKNESKE